MNKYLKESFEKLGKTQKEIMKDLGKSQPYVSALMNGKKGVGKDFAEKLVELYGFDYASILKGNNEIPTQNSGIINNGSAKKIHQNNGLSEAKDFSEIINLFEKLLSKKDEQIDKLLNLLSKQ